MFPLAHLLRVRLAMNFGDTDSNLYSNIKFLLRCWFDRQWQGMQKQMWI